VKIVQLLREIRKKEKHKINRRRLLLLLLLLFLLFSFLYLCRLMFVCTICFSSMIGDLVPLLLCTGRVPPLTIQPTL
jgi:hypothetical protein